MVCVSVSVCMLVTKMAEPIEVSFAVVWQTPVGPTNGVLDGDTYAGATWGTRLNNTCSWVIRPAAAITAATSFLPHDALLGILLSTMTYFT